MFQIPKFLNNVMPALERGTGVEVRVGGIFIHSTPQVSWSGIGTIDGKKRIELGDLLLLMRHDYADGRRPHHSGIILQAKVDDDVYGTPDNPTQHHLYAFWPRFTYHSPILAGLQREITPPLLYAGSKFLKISKSGDRFLNAAKFSSPAIVQPAYPKTQMSRRLSSEIYDLIFGNSGRPFSCDPQDGSENWDQVMTDLIQVTAKRTTGKMGMAGDPSRVRGQGVLCFCAGDVITMTARNTESKIDEPSSPPQKELVPPDKPPEVPEGPYEDEGGISIIEFVIRDEE